MPESKGRKKPSPRRPRQPRKRFTPLEVPEDAVDVDAAEAHRKREITREIPEENRHRVTELPEPATRDQLLVALANLDPLAQEVMLAARLAAFPNPCEGGPPVNIHRKARPTWAHQLRKLGVFCIPELATSELVAPDASGMWVNHTGDTLQSIDRSDIWEKAKAQDPGLGKLVDDAKTPAQKRAAMRKLAAKMPVPVQLAMNKLISTNPDELEPV